MKLVVEASVKGPTVLTGQAAIPVGALPAGWTRRRLGDLGRTYGGLAGKTGADFGRGSARYITFLNVMTNPVIDPRLFEQVVVHPYEHQNEVRKGDLFFNGSSETPEEVAMCSLLDHDVNGVYLNSFCFGFCLDDPDVDGLYLVNFFRSHEGRQLVLPLAQGFTRHNLSKRALLNLTIPVPPLGEQRAICRALTDADHLNQELDGLIAKKRAMKQGAMQVLLSGRTRLPGFGSPWRRKRFGEVAELPRGRTMAQHDFCVELEHLESQTGRLLGSTTARGGSLKTEFRHGDVLFGKLRAYLRKYWAADREGVCSTEIWVLAARPGVMTPNYLYHVVSADAFSDAASTTYGTHMPRSDWNVIASYEVDLPNIDEQAAICRVLSDMDAELRTLEQRRNKAKAVKEGMSQTLLSGRVRLTEPESGADPA